MTFTNHPLYMLYMLCIYHHNILYLFYSREKKCIFQAGNACYYSVQTLLNSRLLSKNLKIKIYKTVIFPVMLHDFETWSLTLREQCRLRVFENRILKQIFGPKRDNRERRRLHSEELQSLYRSPNIARVIKFRR